MARVKTLPLIEASILGPVVDWLEAGGANVERLFDRAQIPGELVACGGWLTKSQVYGFLTGVVHRHRCEELAFASYESFSLSDLGPVAQAMQTAATYKESLDVFCRLAGRSYNGNVFWLVEDGSDAWLCNRVVDDVGDGHEYAQHGSLMVLLQIVRAAAGPSWRPGRIRLQAPETGVLHQTRGLEECQASFDHEHTAVAFPRQLLGRRLAARKERDGGSKLVLSGGLPDNAEGFAESLERLLSSRFPNMDLPTLEQAARITDTSPRTIKRRLFEEGITYRALLNRVRFGAACELLSDARFSVKDVALELGYSGSNNFYRAFKRIAGMTPSEYRQNPPRG